MSSLPIAFEPMPSWLGAAETLATEFDAASAELYAVAANNIARSGVATASSLRELIEEYRIYHYGMEHGWK